MVTLFVFDKKLNSIRLEYDEADVSVDLLVHYVMNHDKLELDGVSESIGGPNIILINPVLASEYAVDKVNKRVSVICDNDFASGSVWINGEETSTEKTTNQ